jgi:hypothetical protein
MAPTTGRHTAAELFEATREHVQIYARDRRESLEARVARTREGHPQHTALLGEWAIGKTTLLMHWRRRLEEAGDRVVLTMAYPQSRDDFLSALTGAIAAETESGWTSRVDLELGLDVGVAEARLRKPVREVEKELRGVMRAAARVGDRRTLIVMVDDIDLVATPADALLQLRAIALERCTRTRPCHRVGRTPRASQPLDSPP